MTKEEKLQLCVGCRNDYYNQSGNSADGECWLLEKARVAQKMRVGIWEDPPYEWAPQETLDCHCPECSVWVEKDDPRVTTCISEYMERVIQA